MVIHPPTLFGVRPINDQPTAQIISHKITRTESNLPRTPLKPPTHESSSSSPAAALPALQPPLPLPAVERRGHLAHELRLPNGAKNRREEEEIRGGVSERDANGKEAGEGKGNKEKAKRMASSSSAKRMATSSSWEKSEMNTSEASGFLICFVQTCTIIFRIFINFIKENILEVCVENLYSIF